MARLSAAQRKRVPKSKEGVPSKHGKPGAYPMPDKKHAAVAKAYVSRYGTPAEKKAVRAKANKILGKGKKKK